MIRGDDAARSRGRKSSVPGKRRKRADGAPAAVGKGSVAWIVVSVFVFIVMFAAVIGYKLFQERSAMLAESGQSYAREAAFIAERTSSRLAGIDGSLDSAVMAISALPTETVAAQGGEFVSALARTPGVLDAALLTADTQILSDGADSAALRLAADAALADDSGTAMDASARSISMAHPVALADGSVGAIVLRLDPYALLPDWNDGRVTILADPEGRPLSIRPMPQAGVFSESLFDRFDLTPEQADRLREGSGAVNGIPLGQGQATFASATLPSSDMRVVLIGPMRMDASAWMRTQILYALLFVAPVIFAVGLGAALSMQMGNLRAARAALGDSERRFRVAIEGARCGVWDWNRKSDNVYVTDSMARILGREEGEVMSSADFLALFSKRDRERLSAAIRGSARAGEIDVELQAANLPIWIHLRGRLWNTGDSVTTDRIVGVAIDVTERKGAQARVAAAENRLRAALESMTESFVLWDSRQRLVLWNRKFRDFFDFTDSGLRPGLPYSDVETEAARAIAAVHGAENGGETYEIELRDGRWLHYSERTTADGGLVSVGADITDLKRQENQLKESESALRRTVEDVKRNERRIAELAKKYEEEKIRAEEANRSKSEFLANMSHELRTPLNAINGFSEIMLREMFGPLGDARYADYVNDIHTSGEHLLALINDILDMSKIEAGKMQLQTEPVRPRDIIEQCVRLVRGRAEEKNIRVVADMIDGPDIEADPRALKQVILNLASNAVKFTPEGGRVTIRTFTIDKSVAIQVSDTGIGIAQDDIPRLARPFEQIESQHSKSHQGSGLGLALSKSLVEMHGGKLAIESTLGEGTTVTFTMPLAADISEFETGSGTDDMDDERFALSDDAA
ncbi:MAG: PAS domain-containing protein [Alphaproteobacteria bacterium]|nr:PAS domain-containing protein [Alphaproteobacteria bacterium]